MIKGHVITIMDLPQSVAAAERCIASAAKYGLSNVQMSPATTPKHKPYELMEKLGLPTQDFKLDVGSRPENVISAFLSHFRLWDACRKGKDNFVIFEHDAVVIDNLPLYVPFEGCMSIGAPSYGKWNQPTQLGRNPLTSKPYFPGAHAYMLNPRGAEKLCEGAQSYAMATDVFLQLSIFPWLEEFFPWPVVAKDSFTTIQNKTGSTAKHNYTKNPNTYEFLSVE